MPDAAGKGSATFSAYSADRTPAAQAQNTTVLPTVDKVRVERSGNQRWLVVHGIGRPVVGACEGDFWQETGFIVVVERPDAGVMETDVEDRAKIGGDIIRNTIGKFAGTLYSTGERDKFRTASSRAPSREPPTYSSAIVAWKGSTSSAKDDTRWQPRPGPELEAEMLRRLMVRLGSENQRDAATSVAAAKAEPRAKLASNNDGTGTLEVYRRFDRAWRRVGLALDRVGFTVEDRDRSKGLYFVRYVDPERDARKPTPAG